MTALAELAGQALDELRDVFARTPPAAVDDLCDELLAAARIVTYGVGREGLMMRALTMRLGHLGLDAHVVGDMTTPAVGAGDMLVVSAGPGTFSTVLALVEVARDAGARVLAITAQPDGAVPRHADRVIHLPAQTMADDQAEGAGILPMGSVYEACQLVLFDLVALRLRERTGQGADDMRAGHTNLE